MVDKLLTFVSKLPNSVSVSLFSKCTIQSFGIYFDWFQAFYELYKYSFCVFSYLITNSTLFDAVT